MKIFKKLLIATLLTNIGAMAMTSKIKNENKTIYEVLKGDSKNHYMKLGLAVNLSYSSEHVGVGEVADINLTITTGLSKGTLKVNLKSLDNEEWDLEEKNLAFELSKTKNSFPINLQLSSQKEGQYFLTVFISLEGQGGRVFEVPVKIGTMSEKVNNKSIEITDKGIAVSSSSAEEEIK